jgi:hypothetical protein
MAMLDRLLELRSTAVDGDEFKALLHKASGDLLIMAMTMRDLMGSGSVNWASVDGALERLANPANFDKEKIHA